MFTSHTKRHNFLLQLFSFHLLPHDIKRPRTGSMTFQAWKIWTLNSTNFQDQPCFSYSIHTVCDGFPLHNRLSLTTDTFKLRLESHLRRGYVRNRIILK